MADEPIIEALVNLKDFTYRVATKALRIINWDSGGTPYYSTIEDITDIAVAEAKEYADALLTPKISPKVGDLTGTFNSSTMTLNDYDCYEVLTNDTYDEGLSLNLYKGIVYWLSNTWVVFYSEKYLQDQVTLSKDSMVFNGVIEDDFDQDEITGKKNGTMFTVTARVKEYQTSQYFRKGIIIWDETTTAFIQLIETAKSQAFIATEGQTEFVVTDFTLGTYLFYCNRIDVTKDTTVSNDTITYSARTVGDDILVLNLS